MRFYPSSIISVTSLLKTHHISLASVSEFEQIQKALRVDPVSPNINGMFRDFLMERGQFEKAPVQCRKMVELDPGQYNSRLRLGSAYAVVHRYAEAESELKKADRFRLAAWPRRARSLMLAAEWLAHQKWQRGQ